MKILFVSISYSVYEKPVPYFRILLPALKLAKQYPDDVVVMFSALGEPNLDEFTKLCDIVVIQQWKQDEGQFDYLNWVKGLGKKLVYETDDLELFLPPHQAFSKVYIKDVRNGIQNTLNKVDLITTTTPTLKRELQNFTDRPIIILPNKLDLEDPLWNLPINKPCDETLVLYAGNTSHYYDLLEVSSQIIQAITQTNSKFILAGYSTKGRNIEIDKEGRIVKIEQLEKDPDNICDKVVKMFSQLGNKLIVRDFLHLFEYPKIFTEADIVIAPLKDDRFNRSKSELKAVEAGVYSLPIVCSDIDPYRIIIRHGHNGFLTKPSKFAKYLKMLINDPELRATLGRNLRKMVERKYNANDQSDRFEAYKNLLK